MCLASHSRWQGSDAFREGRLLGQHNVEVLSENTSESSPEAGKQKIQDVPAEVRNAEEKQAILEKTHQEIIQAEQAALREVITKQQRPTSSEKRGEKSVQKTEKPTEKSWADWIGWNKLSPKTQDRIIVGTAVIGTAVGVVALYKFGKWLFGKAKHGVDQAKVGLGRVGKTVLIGSALALAYFGFSGAQAYATEKMKEKVTQKVDEGVRMAEEKYAALSEQLRTATGEQRKIIEQQLAETRAQMEKIQAKLTKVSKPVPTPHKETPQTNLNPGKTNEESSSGKETKPNVGGVAIEVLKEGSLPLIARALVAFEKMPDWDAQEKTRVQHVIDVFSTSQKKNMAEVFSSVSGNIVQTPLFATVVDRESHEKAQILIVRYCEKNRAQLRASGVSEADIQGMSLEKYLTAIGGSYAVAGSIFEKLRMNSGDFLKAMQETDIRALFSSNGGLQQEINSFLHDRKKQLNGVEVSALELAQVLPKLEQSAGEFLGNYEKVDMPEKIKNTIRELCLEMDSIETFKYMLPFFHNIFPEHDWSEATVENIATARQILMNNMPLHQAVRFHLYVRMMRKGNAAGVVLTQAEIFKYVVDRDQGMSKWTPWAKNNDIRMADSIAGVASKGTWEEWNKMDLDVDDRLVYEAMDKMGIVAKDVGWNSAAALLGFGTKGAVAGLTLSWNHPVTIGTPVALLSSLIAFKRYKAYKHSSIPHEVVSTLRKMIDDRAFFKRAMRGMRGLEVSYEAVVSAEAHLDELMQALRKAVISGGESKKVAIELTEEVYKCTTATFKNGRPAWNRLWDAAKRYQGQSTHIDEVIRIIGEVRADEAVCNAISVAAKPYIGRMRYLLIPFAQAKQLIRGVPLKPGEATELLRTLAGGEELVQYKPVRYLLQSGDPEAVARLLAEAHEGFGLAGSKRAANYLLSLTHDAHAATRSPEVVKMVASGQHGNPGAIGRFLSRTARIEGAVTAQSYTRAIEQMTKWQKLGRGGKLLYGVGGVAQAALFGYEVYTAMEAKNGPEGQTEQMNALKEELTKLGLAKSAKDPSIYEGSGVQISLTTLDPTEFEAATTRAIISGGALATTILAPSFVLGPGGLVVTGVVITAMIAADTYWSAEEQERHLAFLSKAPPWLLAILGTEKTVRRTGYETMQEFDGMMISDVIPQFSSPLEEPVPLDDRFLQKDREQDKQRVRENTLLAMCYRELAASYPELLAELPGGTNPKEFLDPKGEFLKSGGGFERIVRPYIVLKLHAGMTGEGVAFGTTNALSINEKSGGFFDQLLASVPSISEYDLKDAIEEGMLLYLSHVREKRYQELQGDIEKHIAAEETRLLASGMNTDEREKLLTLYREALEAALDEGTRENVSHNFIFNVHPDTLPKSEDGMTVAERLIQDRYKAESSDGFRLPWSTEDTTIQVFAAKYLRPQFRASLESRLKQESPKDGPFSFSDLEAMSTSIDPEIASREFLDRFSQAIEPIRRVQMAFAETTSTDAALKEKCQTYQPDIEFALRLGKHEAYYRDYIHEWRQLSSGLMPHVHSDFFSLLSRWAEQKYPVLIDETLFQEFQRTASPSSSEGKLIMNYSGYNVFRSSERKGKTPLLPLQSSQNLTLGAPEGLSVRMQGAGTEDLPKPGKGYLDAEGKMHPLAELQERKDILLLSPDELHHFEQTMNRAGPLTLSKKPSSQEFAPLRWYLLESRVFVAVDTRPQNNPLQRPRSYE